MIKNLLKKFKHIEKRKREGFTLIETLVTVSIIAMISGIAIVSYTKAQNKAEESVDYATAASIATAAQLAVSDGKTSISLATLESDGYLEAIPTPKSVTGSFTVTVGTDGSITVSVGSKPFYPKE